ncbi:hypothetical protein PPYR_07858 [Photinus pyralis]|uniref:Phosphoserine phosphatase n=3 Tax=Photinus pyralis TaxID=7054 RepID=A0A1Y1KBM4_PHOPY|nr:phosphoserine phosphatase [Photinus pyralis]XP_031340130.1 phosphoserine phosphatase [Photinus pyralis]XP_031340131.1 phosphoserine phosphatase [Photinus pyralis]XP_031340132.1 phosphoserine phosphatase [Photinus pyralis]KAB0799978.1 hypothetical protein PPYR_07858 [Photinus pyralis]
MEDVLKVWQRADAVCLDVDSTTIQEEGIDELAKFCGKGETIRNLTSKAMGGKMTFEEALKLRLDLLQPSLTQIDAFIRDKPATLTPGIEDLVQMLHEKTVPVYLVSGGFRRLIGPVAKRLNIPEGRIYANTLLFSDSGEYAGFDINEPTSRSGGKGKVIEELKRLHGYKSVVMIGDGMTDLEACPPGDAFIGFGGVVIREAVKDKAKWYILEFRELIDSYKQ